MTTTAVKPAAPAAEPPVELHSGDRMGREEFHRLYERTPEGFKAELIGGTVFVASPLKLRHGTSHPLLASLLVAYQARTPGVETGDNVTVLLGDEGEPQPDLFLRVLPEFGGLSRTTPDEYVEGPPELVAEITHSRRAIDLHAKLDDYRRYGVPEYLVWDLGEPRLRWFDLAADRELQPDADGVYRVRTFPGLWVHGEALLARDYQRLMQTLEHGLATAEHAAFVAKLAATRAARQAP